MKTLYLARHAKSSWDNPANTDFERPLNKRGKNDAPMMAEILRDNHQSPPQGNARGLPAWSKQSPQSELCA